jgi:hypothetical protein
MVTRATSRLSAIRPMPFFMHSFKPVPVGWLNISNAFDNILVNFSVSEGIGHLSVRIHNIYAYIVMVVSEANQSLQL